MTDIRVRHKCPKPACRRYVGSDVLACSPHWFEVPAKMRRAIWEAWDNGRGAGTPGHVVAIAAAIRFLEGETPE